MTVNVLNNYQISIHDFEALDLLIEEAKIAQIQCDYLAPLKKPLKTLAAIIVPIIVYVAEKIGRWSDFVTLYRIFVVVGAYSARTAHPFQRNGAPFRFKLSKAQQVY